jgi:hypothetical protein
MTWAKRGTVGAAMVAVCLLLGAMPAVANSSVHSPDDGAVAAYKTAENRFHLKDNKCDSRYVYLNYRLDGGTTQRAENHNGCNSIVYVPIATSGFDFVEYRVCTNINIFPDSCSSWVRDFDL